MLEQLNNEVLLIQQDVDIELLELKQLLYGLNVRVLASKVQGRCQLLNMPLLVFFELFVVLELVHAHVGCLD